MKIVPKKNRMDIFDDVFDNVLKSPLFALSNKIIKMQTDVRELENSYILDIDLAGFKKENINIVIEEGYLKVDAQKDTTFEETDNYIRKERQFESCSRYYYIGNVTLEEIRASYQDGILQIIVPKEKPVEEAKKFIPID